MSFFNVLNPYSWLINAKNQLYDSNFIQREQFAVPVISVGNINTGGSGKTPFIHFLVTEIMKIHPDYKILIVSKSYKAILKKPTEVLTTDINKPHIFGDEPCLLKSMTEADVWSGPTKYKTLQQALSKKKYDLAIIDDGFSHLKIKRQLDIVLFDVSQTKKHYKLIPLGFMREPWVALKRSDFVILTKIENQDQNKMAFFKNKISDYQKNILSANFQTNIQIKTRNIFLVTGIGNPKAIMHFLKSTGYNVIKSMLYQDHFKYPIDEQLKILKAFNECKSNDPDTELCMTSKDIIKITNTELMSAVNPIQLVISMNPADFKKILNKISEITNEK